MKAVILAGGFGTRLSEETDTVPKPMVQVGGRPVLWHLMKTYSHFGISDFVVCLGYKGYVIKEFFQNYSLHMCDVTFDLRNRGMEVHRNQSESWRVTLVDTGLNTMTGGRLKRIASHLSVDTFCMTYGDGLSDIDLRALLRFHASHGKLATVTVINPPGRFGLVEVAGQKVTGFREKPTSSGSLINGGFFVLGPRALDYIDGDATSWEQSPLERLAADGQLMAYHHTGFWQPMDTLREKKLLEELWSAGRAPWKVWHDE